MAISPSTDTPTRPTKLRRFISMFDLSLDAANALYSFSYYVLIVGAFAVFFGTMGVYWSNNFRDKHAEQRVANNEVETVKANEEAARAHERTTMLDLELEQQRERAANAEKQLLELRERLAPRTLNTQQQANITQKAKAFTKHKINIITPADDVEIINVGNKIIDALQAAGWLVGFRTGVDTSRAVSGMIVEVDPNADRTVQEAANNLVTILAAENLKVGLVTAHDSFTGMSTGHPIADAKIRLFIGKK